MHKVSVVIPAYNRARFLPECLESVLGQTFRDFEILVIDDGSTDNTPEVVAAYCPPVRYVCQENQGMIAAYNKGIELARGEYIAILDSDDVLLEDALRLRVDIMDRYPEVGFSYGQAHIIDEESRMLRLRRRRSKGPFVWQGKEEIGRLLLGNYIPCSTVMIRRSCFEVVGLFDSTFRQGSEDFDMWLRLAKRYDVAYIDKPLAKFRVHAQTISAGRQVEEVEWAHDLIFQSIFNDAELGHLYRHLRAKAYFHLYCQLACIAIPRGDMRIARNYLIRALKIHPRGIFKSLGLPWILSFTKTWMPQPILALARSGKRYLRSITLPQVPTRPQLTSSSSLTPDDEN